MYRLSQLKSGIKHPRLILRELNRYYFTQLKTKPYNNRGIEIFDEDWDNLLLLDACRYDIFDEIHSLPGHLEQRESKASETVGFLTSNFSDKDLRDTVYVTANPQLYRHWDEIEPNLHEIINVWDQAGWDDELGTVRPETTTEYAVQAAEEYDDKRLIVHYIQPHYPFLTTDVTFDKGHLESEEDEENLWYRKLYGELDIEANELWNLYTETLKQTLPHVERLIKSLQGRSVVTADHGNMFGERSFPIPIREWGHPHSIFTEELVSVPWLVVGSDERREIVAEDHVATTDIASDVSDRLQQLGYRS
ncbi:hypothetical protein GJ630_10500 [Haloarcula sp. CBA1122]|nr:hypothetical protein [Haloarcula sp. CBA1122]